eukprot:1160813-Pelagomonas_calceolata.AAC.5
MAYYKRPLQQHSTSVSIHLTASSTHRSSQVHIMLHQPHAGVPGPTLAVVVAHDVLIVGIGVLCRRIGNQDPLRETTKRGQTLKLGSKCIILVSTWKAGHHKCT